MPRIRTIELDGLSVKISPMSWDDLDAYIAEGKELAAKKDPPTTINEWGERIVRTVCSGLNRAALASNDEKWTPERIKSQLDGPFITLVHRQYLEMSGLVVNPQEQRQGEASATPTSS